MGWLMRSTRCAVLLLTATAVATISRPSHAQTAGDGFLFRVPVGTWSVRGGFDHAFASGDLFNFVTKQLTIDRSDFSSATFGSNVAVRVSPVTDIVFDISYASVSRLSEFRDWVDQNNLPIQQRTSLRRVPITLGVRHYLSARGRAIGRFAWIPAAHDTYVGLGAGLMQYRFHQIGDFVDPQTLNVFPDEFESKAWTPVLHALAGVDLGLARFLMVNGEARYTWARGPMGRDYVGFHRIDLSGLSLTAGLSLRL
ncbi:MAG: hypothetical protein AUI86_03235 [Gemmatimonadetes bacterium 13_1_40CM_3_66_12]|nr:MAG: hypothetical protein AUI86_03235 [Gemmatimonadetes bacterium 13_1_40CM_3_66_12]